VLAAPYAYASEVTSDASTLAASELATTMQSELSDDVAGAYRHSVTGRLVVNVTDNNAAKRARKAGADPRMVTRSGTQLRAATDDLDRSAAIPGTSWSIDPMNNQVHVTADSTVTGADLDRLKAAVAKLGDAARLEMRTDTLSPHIAGGDAIRTRGSRCSAGFNVHRGNASFMLTAGHCTNIGATWADGAGRLIGQRVASRFPGNDFGLIAFASNSSVSRPSAVTVNGRQQPINGAANAVVGLRVIRSGSTSGVHDGVVTGLNATVNYREGRVFGMIQTNVCAEPGDSGGPLFSGDRAIGLTSGGNGNCTIGGTNFFQPVGAALAAVGATIP
jgi:streptogrisin D